MAQFPLRNSRDAAGRYLVRGQEVLNVQRFLNRTRQHRPAIKEDGIFGPETEGALAERGLPTEISQMVYDRMMNYQAGPPAVRSGGRPMSPGTKRVLGGLALIAGTLILYSMTGSKK